MRLKFVALLISVLLFGGYAKASDFSAVCESGQTLYYNITSNVEPYTVEVEWTGSWFNLSGDLEIPETVTYNSITYSVTSIGIGGFANCIELTSVIIPNSVTSIGACAFYSCNGLTSVIIPNSVLSIGQEAFYNCNHLTSVSIGNSVTSIGNSAFSNCSGLTTINFNAINCTTMGSSSYPVFNRCSSLSTLNIGENVTNIPEYAFYGCSGLTSVAIPNSVTSIGIYAFSGCSGLTSVTIPNSVSSIGDNAFYLVKNIVYEGTATGSPWGALAVNGIFDGDFIYSDAERTNLAAYIGNGGDVVIPNSVVCILPNAFNGCSAMGALSIGTSVKTIGSSAFSGCTSLTEINISDSVEVICEYAFAGCSNVSTLTIGSAVDSIALSAFDGCLGLTTVNFNARNCTYMGSNNNPVFGNSPSVTTLNIGENVTNIPEYAFKYCSHLTSVTISNSVTNIDNSAFSGCSGLSGTLTIPNSVTNIGENAFNNCSGLTSITIGNSVMSIGNFAFYECSSLTGNLIIPNSVESVGRYAFEACSGFASVTIGTSVTYIGFAAFHNCSNLSVINYNAVQMNLINSQDAFWRGTNNTVLNIGDSVVIIPDPYFFSTSSDTDLAEINVSSANPIFDSRNGCNAVIETATNKLVLGCKNTIIPNTVTSIGADAFKRNPYLTSINIPNSVTRIEWRAFDGCFRLVSVSIGNSVDSIYASAFDDCSNLADIYVKSTIPPFLNGNVYNYSSATLWVPCGYAEVYGAAAYWRNFNDIRESRAYLLSVESNNNIWGTANITQQPSCEDGIAVISATANEHYRFVQWSDGNTENPRTVIVEGDTVFIAEFEGAPYRITIESADTAMGSVCEGGTYNYGTEIQISATAIEGYAFLSWNDGNTDNPRTIIVEGDTTFTAIFDEARTVTLETSNSEMGTVIGSGVYAVGAVVEITAVPNEGYSFDHWVDVYNPSREINTDNPRTIVVSTDVTYMAVFTDVVGLEDNSVPEITVFPNPTNDILNITSSETISEIEIVNMNGQVVRRVEINGDNAVCNVADLRSGVYIVRISTATATLSQRKFVKE